MVRVQKKEEEKKSHYSSIWMSKTSIACLFMKHKGNSWPTSPKRIIVLSNLVFSGGSPSFPPCFLFEVLSGSNFLSWLVWAFKRVLTTLHDTSVNKDYTGSSEDLKRLCLCQGVSLSTGVLWSAWWRWPVLYRSKTFRRLKVSHPWSQEH